jgi:hypothetical protein
LDLYREPILSSYTAVDDEIRAALMAAIGD